MVAEIGIGTTLCDSFERTIERTMEALENAGFEVAMKYDVRTAMRQDSSLDDGRSVVLGVRVPLPAHLALRAFLTKLDVAFVLRCFVTVQEGKGNVVVTAADPLQTLRTLGDDPIMTEVAVRTKARLERAISSLQ